MDWISLHRLIWAFTEYPPKTLCHLSSNFRLYFELLYYKWAINAVFSLTRCSLITVKNVSKIFFFLYIYIYVYIFELIISLFPFFSYFRLYSDYLFFYKTARKSQANFHKQVVDGVQIFTGCLHITSLRSCVYNKEVVQLLQV